MLASLPFVPPHSYQALPPFGRRAAALMRLGQAITRFCLTSFFFPPRARHFSAFRTRAVSLKGSAAHVMCDRQPPSMVF